MIRGGLWFFLKEIVQYNLVKKIVCSVKLYKKKCSQNWQKTGVIRVISG